MAWCRWCSQPVSWIYSVAEGRSVMVDDEPVFVDLRGGDERFISDEGTYITGRPAGPETPSEFRDVAFKLHACWRNRQAKYIKK